jgi:hypothetical protein
MLKVKIANSTRGRSVGIAQNIVFENGASFVTGAYSSIDWETKEKLIARLARVWNMTSSFTDEELDLIETFLQKAEISFRNGAG